MSAPFAVLVVVAAASTATADVCCRHIGEKNRMAGSLQVVSSSQHSRIRARARLRVS